MLGEESEVLGVNDRVQLAEAETIAQDRLRRAAMQAGATMIDPASVYLSADAKIGRDVTIEPHVWIGPKVEIGEGAVIHAFSHLESAKIGPGANVGPFARLRPGADLAEGAKVGNFVEIKAAKIGAGAKVSHLTYIGDAESRRRGQYRRGNDHLQLRRIPEISHSDRRGRLHRLQFVARRARHDRRRRLCGVGLRRDEGCEPRRARRRARTADRTAGLGAFLPREAEREEAQVVICGAA